LPGSAGNVSIAAHRDSFFRGLRDVAVGDMVELDSLEYKNLYRVTGTQVVEPTDVQVLADVGEPVLTLITCYPFHFVGKAPQRFIVRAAAVDIRK
jgi:sortase A